MRTGTMAKLEQYTKELAGKSAEEILAWCLKEFSYDRVILASMSPPMKYGPTQHR